MLTYKKVCLSEMNFRDVFSVDSIKVLNWTLTIFKDGTFIQVYKGQQILYK
jgi:hypothetical protein